MVLRWRERVPRHQPDVHAQAGDLPPDPGRGATRVPARHPVTWRLPSLRSGSVVGDCLTGSVSVKVDPLPTVLSTEISPPWSSTNRRVSVSPRPLPSCFRAKPAP